MSLTSRRTAMARKRYKPEEIVAKLRQVDVLVSQGQNIVDAIRQIGVSEVTYYRWRQEFGGLKTEQVKRLKDLELEHHRTFAANAVRLQLHALAYNLGNFLRTLATPEPIKHWSLTTLKDNLIKIGAKVVSHGRYIIFQMAEVAIARQMFQEILRLIAELRPQPPPALA